MSVIKQSIINRDQSDKRWLTEDFENHWTAPETKAADKTLTYFLLIIAVLLTAIVYVVFGGL